MVTLWVVPRHRIIYSAWTGARVNARVKVMARFSIWFGIRARS